MTERLKEIFSVIPRCSVFADIGCDHGYVSKAMLDSDKCEKVIFSDVSEKCLQKARALLERYVALGKAEGVVCNGFDKISYCDCALIAGMGGEEITGIVSRADFLPEKLILQPMKNSDKVRTFCVDSGYRIIKDYTFCSEKIFYDLIVLERGKDKLSAEEAEFGRTNLAKSPEAFKQHLKNKINKLSKALKSPSLKKDDAEKINNEISRLKKYV